MLKKQSPWLWSNSKNTLHQPLFTNTLRGFVRLKLKDESLFVRNKETGWLVAQALWVILRFDASHLPLHRDKISCLWLRVQVSEFAANRWSKTETVLPTEGETWLTRWEKIILQVLSYFTYSGAIEEVLKLIIQYVQIKYRFTACQPPAQYIVILMISTLLIREASLFLSHLFSQGERKHWCITVLIKSSILISPNS